MRKILVTGGCGYIGSHMVKALVQANVEVIVLDDLSSGHLNSIIDSELIIGNIGDTNLLNQVFSTHTFDSVIHFASLIQVGESIVHPSRYYENNVCKTLTLMNAMVHHKVKHMVFSSTAAVFGDPVYVPIDEKHPCQPINAYGRTKLVVEGILKDFDRAYDLKSVALRYFNAAGADPLSRIGEHHEPETHLIPLAIGAAMGRRASLRVFGADYDTHDGTCIRDYVHVDDLAAAHMAAVLYLQRGGGSDCFNLGNGNGFSVKQVIDTVESVTGRAVPHSYEERRVGDPARLIADSGLARKILGWTPSYPQLCTIVDHAFKWETTLAKQQNRALQCQIY